MKQNPFKKYSKKPLAAGISAALMAVFATSANAETFNVGDFTISFDSTFSIGSSWRVENRNWNKTIGKINHPRFDLSAYHPALNANPINFDIWQQPGTYSSNGDNGNLNYDAGEAFSQVFKGTHDLDINLDNQGIFLRGMYYYDFKMSDGDLDWVNPVSGVESDPCRDSESSAQVCSDVRLLDAFYYGDFDVGEMPLSIRVGNQLIGWGESALISHGISEINPVDIARLKAPGAEIKEAFIPFGAVWASLGVSDTFNVEFFYQYKWEKTVLPAPGSYFSTNDFAGDGGYYNNIQLGFTGNPDMDATFLLQNLNQIGDGLRAGQLDMASAMGMYLANPTKVALRGKGSAGATDPEDGGQYGLRLSWYLENFNDTEVSLYYLNYHSRRPLIAGITSNFTDAGLAADLSYLAQNQITVDNVTELQAFTKAVLVYPEDIKAYAMSFNTTLGTAAIAGEFTYRQDEPLQIDDVELLFAAMPQQLANEGVNPAFRREDLAGISQMGYFDPGAYAEGFVLADTSQAQFTVTQLFGPTIGASQFTMLFEAGGVWIHDMPDQSELRLNAPGTARNGGIEGKEGLEFGLQGGRETNPFADDFAWGYKLVAKLDYTDVFAGINVSPRVVLSHDVSGTTPDPMFLFVEDRKSVAATVSFDYQSRWSADISYNAFFGGAPGANLMEDRDYVSFNIKYSL